MRSLLARLPIRVRLALAFAGVMALVLVATGLFLYLRLSSELNASVDQGLRSRASDISTLVRRSDFTLAEASPRGRLEDESFAQVLDASGGVVDAPPALRGRALLSRAELDRARRGTIVVEKDEVDGGEGPVRILATPVRARGATLVVAVGEIVDDRRDALRRLGTLLLVGGPIALLLASLAGYGVAAGALRPVEAMRRRAAAIEAARTGERLPVPPTRDEVARLGETLNEMLDRLAAASERERGFVADASHELRTPLSILKAELEVALRRGRTREELEAALRSASEETDRLAQLAEDLLVIAHSDQGRLPIRRERVGVVELLDAVAARFGARVDVTVDAVPGLVVDADPRRLEQALGNLIDNAVRHGGGTVELAAVASGGALELHVRDDGPGFPPALLATAFDRFTRGDPARGRGGAGLGLSIVEAIASAHGGRAEAANRPGAGADVWIVVPGEPLSSTPHAASPRSSA
jgi:signal transduction histidine kinase